jgi:hypothetical protein
MIYTGAFGCARLTEISFNIIKGERTCLDSAETILKLVKH